MATVYLIHFQKPVGRCYHYIGYCASETLDQRMQRHRTNNGAKLLQECNRRGIQYDVVATWICNDWKSARSLERAMKRQHNHKRFCPVCNELKQIADEMHALHEALFRAIPSNTNVKIEVLKEKNNDR